MSDRAGPAPDAEAAAAATPGGVLQVRGTDLVDGAGAVVRLRGAGLGGWMNMENFITGYPATETLMRRAVARVLGDDRAGRFFERLLTSFFTDDDAAFLASLGLNCVRLPVNYRRLTDDLRPFEITEDGFRQLDRAVSACARHGVFTVLDLHALPGFQNADWHSDNPTHHALFWDHRHFQDQVVHLWEVIADRYRDNPWVAGYNPVNEPADPDGTRLAEFYERLVPAIRAVDPDHVLFLDGNAYASDSSVFRRAWDNTVYVCHDYALAGFRGDYPGVVDGAHVDRDVLERTFLERTASSRQTGTPVWVGEFGPVYTGDPVRDAPRFRVLADQLAIYAEHGASWSIWTYKDVGLQGLVYADPESAYLRRFGAVIAKKARLGADGWGSSGDGVRAATEPLQELVAREFPGFTPYVWNTRRWVDRLIRHILLAEPLLEEYAERFRGLGDDELDALAGSFALARCVRRQPLCDLLRDHAR